MKKILIYWKWYWRFMDDAPVWKKVVAFLWDFPLPPKDEVKNVDGTK